MNCRYHKESEAKYICEKCKQPVCEACAVEVMGKRVCNRCIERSLFANEQQPRRGGFFERFAFFCFAVIPGAAYMYMNLFRRGFQMMFTVIAALIVVSYVNIEALIPLIIVPSWFFSFFDSYYLRRRLRNDEVVEDELLYDYNMIFKYKKIVGVSMLILGIIGLTNALQYWQIERIFGSYFSGFYWSIRRSIVPLLLILVGTGILRRSRKNEEDEVLDSRFDEQFGNEPGDGAENQLDGGLDNQPGDESGNELSDEPGNELENGPEDQADNRVEG